MSREEALAAWPLIGGAVESRLRRDLREGKTEIVMPIAWVDANDQRFILTCAASEWLLDTCDALKDRYDLFSVRREAIPRNAWVFVTPEHVNNT